MKTLEEEQQDLIASLYEVYQMTENEEVFEIIGRAIDFVKRAK
jgi:hypothetical protein